MTATVREMGPDLLAADLLGDAWSWMILRDAIFDGVTRFEEFHQRLGIARKVLSKRLENLTMRGLFLRRHVRQDGGHLEYVLTEMGRDFHPCLLTAQSWGDRWCSDRGNTTRRALHVPFGHSMEAVLCCSECGHKLEAREVTVASVYRASTESTGARRHRSPDLDLIERSQACSIARALRIIGDRWSSLIVRECFLGTRRFSEFEAHLGIAPNILASRLNRLVDLGVLVKTAYQNTPEPREYRLTEKGLDFYPVPLALLTWTGKWLSNGRPVIDLRHKPCGKHFVSVLTCATCGERVGADDIAIEHTRLSNSAAHDTAVAG
jgi:DNA-binding HxlR family transcriptional regulator